MLISPVQNVTKKENTSDRLILRISPTNQIGPILINFTNFAVVKMSLYPVDVTSGQVDGDGPRKDDCSVRVAHEDLLRRTVELGAPYGRGVAGVCPIEETIGREK